jgi:hypothetical protein
MNFSGRHILPVFGFSILAVVALAKSDLNTPEQRLESVNRVMALTQPAPLVPLPADLKNPFVLNQDKKNDAGTSRLAGDREVLTAIAPYIVPSGVVQVGDSPILLLREKKLKVGDYLTITFEGTDYMIELAAINRSSFTLRLNKEEITQPINP